MLKKELKYRLMLWNENAFLFQENLFVAHKFNLPLSQKNVSICFVIIQSFTHEKLDTSLDFKYLKTQKYFLP